MRITHGVMVSGFLGDMNTNLNSLNKIQKQLNTGKEFSKPSDDPFKVARSMQMYSEINANKQYNTNIKDTINWMDTTDTALSNGTKCLQRIRELMVSAGNAAYGSSELTAIKEEINERVAEFGQILNTSFDGKYIFGGKDGASKPVIVTETAKVTQTGGNANSSTSEISISGLDKYAGSAVTWKVTELTTTNVKIDGTEYNLDANKKVIINGVELDFNNILADVNLDAADTWDVSIDNVKNSISISGDANIINKSLKVEISSGVTVDYNVNAVEVLKFKDKEGNGNVVDGAGVPTGEMDVMKFFDDLLNNLSDINGKSKVVGENLDQIDKVINNMLSVSAKVGTVQNRMESAKDLNTAQNENLTEILSGNEDIDFMEKSMEMAVARTIYVASLQTSSKVLQPSILDFL